MQVDRESSVIEHSRKAKHWDMHTTLRYTLTIVYTIYDNDGDNDLEEERMLYLIER